MSFEQAYHTVASSIRPESRKKSPNTLNSLPGDDATPIPLIRFLFVEGSPSVDCRKLLELGVAGLLRLDAVDVRFRLPRLGLDKLFRSG